MNDRRAPSRQDLPTLGARAVIRAVEEVARAKHLLGWRVGYKKNDKGEHVVALIFPPQPP
jgi:hypothetical protein